MKTFKILLAVLFGSITGLHAQFVSGPATGSAIDTSTAVAIVGSSTSNLTTTLQKVIPVGQLGVGFAITLYGTNAATTTNATIRLQGTVDGYSWFDAPNPLVTLSAGQNGTSLYTTYTNVLPNAVASQNAGNVRYLRVASIQNTNLATIWVSNFVWSIKQ